MPPVATDPAAGARVWFITGASSGFGLALALAALERGDKVIATARTPEQIAWLARRYGDRVATTRLDVTRQSEIDASIAFGIERFGRIDMLVNNAGYGYLAAVEEGEDREIRDLFETNVFGLAAVTRAALPALREGGSGVIINLSSRAVSSACRARAIMRRPNSRSRGCPRRWPAKSSRWACG